jgi:hypothetical protein
MFKEYPKSPLKFKKEKELIKKKNMIKLEDFKIEVKQK